MEEHRKTRASCVHLKEKRGAEMSKPSVFPQLYQKSKFLYIPGWSPQSGRERPGELYKVCTLHMEQNSKSGEGASPPTAELIVTLQHGRRLSSQQHSAGANHAGLETCNIGLPDLCLLLISCRQAFIRCLL